MQWHLGLLYARKVTACACLISTRVLGFFSSLKRNLDLSYSELNIEFPPAQLCGVVNPENCLAVVQVKTLDVKYLPLLHLIQRTWLILEQKEMFLVRNPLLLQKVCSLPRVVKFHFWLRRHKLHG